jgi:hypothetical protein
MRLNRSQQLLALSVHFSRNRICPLLARNGHRRVK